MAALAPEATVPTELMRQSERITEQLKRLNGILTTVRTYLEGMDKTMKGYSLELRTQIVNLSNYIEKYQVGTQKIYSEMADSLKAYALNLTNNLNTLTESVGKVGKMIDALN